MADKKHSSLIRRILWPQRFFLFSIVIVSSSTIDKKTRNHKKLENELEIDKNLENRLELLRPFSIPVIFSPDRYSPLEP